MLFSGRVSAYRREPNSHNAAQPRKAAHPQNLARSRHSPTMPESQGNRVSKDMGPLCLIETVHCVGSIGFQSVGRAAACFHPGAANRCWRLEDAAHQLPRRRAGAGRGGPVALPGCLQALYRRRTCTSLPNPSLNRSANGRPPGPPSGEAYHPHVGPGVLPSAPA